MKRILKSEEAVNALKTMSQENLKIIFKNERIKRDIDNKFDLPTGYRALITLATHSRNEIYDWDLLGVLDDRNFNLALELIKTNQLMPTNEAYRICLLKYKVDLKKL